MSEPGPVMGPPCDVCGGQEPSIFSLMQFADYSQVKVGPGCAEAFLRGVADQVAAAAPAGRPGHLPECQYDDHTSYDGCECICHSEDLEVN